MKILANRALRAACLAAAPLALLLIVVFIEAPEAEAQCSGTSIRTGTIGISERTNDSLRVVWNTKRGSSTHIHLDWKRRDQSLYNLGEVTTWVSAKGYRISGLAANTAYDVRVFDCRNANSCSPTPIERHADDQSSTLNDEATLTDRPAGLEASGLGQLFRFGWSRPGGPVNITRYELRWKPAGAEEYPDRATNSQTGATSYFREFDQNISNQTVLKSLTAGDGNNLISTRPWTFRVRAQNHRGGWSDWSDETTIAVSPTSPRSVAAVPGERHRVGHPDYQETLPNCDNDNEICLSWEPPSGDGGKPVHGYRVQWRKWVEGQPFGDGWSTERELIRPSTAREALMQVSPHERHDFRIQAFNEDRAGNWVLRSVAGRPSILDEVPIRSSVAHNKITFTWNPPTEVRRGGKPITGYDYQWRVQRDGQAPGAGWRGSSRVSYNRQVVLDGLDYETTYEFRVRGNNEDRTGYFSRVVAATTEDALRVTIDTGLAHIRRSAITINEGSSVVPLINLSRTEPRGVSIGWEIKSGTAKQGGDIKCGSPFSGCQRTRTFSGTQTELTGYVLTHLDDIFEDDETFQLALTGWWSGNDQVRAVLSEKVLSVTIRDDDAPPRLSVSDARVVEGGEVEFTVSLHGKTEKVTTVDWATSNGSADTATLGGDFSDYTAANGSFTFAGGSAWQGQFGGLNFTPGDTSKTIRVQTSQDFIDEPDETFTVTLSNPVNATLGDATATGTIEDDDAAPTGVSLSLGLASVDESDVGQTHIVVNATVEGGTTFGSPYAIEVNVGQDGDQAVRNTDYQPVPSFDLVIPAATTEYTGGFLFSTIDDGRDEGDAETLTVTFEPTGSVSVSPDAFTLTIVDNDGPPTGVRLTADLASVDEGAGEVSLFLTAQHTGGATQDKEREVAVSVGSSDDTATEGADYKTVDDFIITIPAFTDRAFQLVTLDVEDDSLFEGDESLTISGATDSLPVTTWTVSIVDNDTEPTGITLTVDPALVAEDGGVGDVGVTATVDGPSTFVDDQEVMVTVTEDAEFFDVEPDSFTITIPAGEASGQGQFSITPVDNSYTDGARTATISGVSGSLEVTGTELAVLEDDVTPTSITLSVEPDAVAENLLTVTPGGAEITVTATLDGDTLLPTDQVVDLTVSGDGFEEVSPFSVTILAGTASVSGTFTLLPVDNLVHDGGKTLTVSGAIEAAETDTGGTPTETETGETLTVHSANLSIVDDEPAPTGITLEATPRSGGPLVEGSGGDLIILTASVDGPSRFAVPQSVRVNIIAPGEWLTFPEGTEIPTGCVRPCFNLTIPADVDEVQHTFVLALPDDSAWNPDFNVRVSGRHAGGLPVTAGAVTIVDNDTEPGGIRVSVDPASVPENAGPTEVTVTAAVIGESPYGADMTVAVAVGAWDDSAVAGEDGDYQLAIGDQAVTAFDIRIPGGQSSATGTFTLTPSNDAVFGGDKTLTITATIDTTWDVTIEDSPVAITIEEDEAEPTEIALSVRPAGLFEDETNGREITVTATIQGQAAFPDARTVTVRVGASNDSAVAGSDYEAVAEFDISIAAGALSGTGKFTLRPIDNGPNQDQTVTVGGESGTLKVTSTTVTISGIEATPAPEEPEPGDA